MDKNLQKAAESFLASEEGRRVSDKRPELEALASSEDGAAVRGILQRGSFEEAVKNGDAEAVRRALSEVMSTDAGSRLVRSLQQLMNGR